MCLSNMKYVKIGNVLQEGFISLSDKERNRVESLYSQYSVEYDVAAISEDLYPKYSYQKFLDTYLLISNPDSHTDNEIVLRVLDRNKKLGDVKTKAFKSILDSVDVNFTDVVDPQIEAWVDGTEYFGQPIYKEDLLTARNLIQNYLSARRELERFISTPQGFAAYQTVMSLYFGDQLSSVLSPEDGEENSLDELISMFNL